MKVRIPAVLLALSLAASAFAADYVADIRFGPSDEDVLTLPFDESREIHKAPDATMRFPITFEDRQPVEYDECGLGLSVDLTEFECDGENVGYDLEYEYRHFDKWQVESNEAVTALLPTFQSYSVHLHGMPGKLGEWMDFGHRRDDTDLRPSLRIRKADSGEEENE